MMRLISNLVTYRELLYFLAWRKIKARYKQAVLGVAWAFLQPCLLMVLFVVIGRVFDISTGGVPRPIFYYSAALPWALFSNAVASGSTSLVTHASLVRQIYFPRELFPFSAILMAGFDFLMGAIVFIILVIYYQISPTWSYLYLPLLLAVQVVFMMGLVLLGSGLHVVMRDVSLVISFVLQLWMYATPIVYPLSAIPEHLRPFYLLNPMAGLIEGYRRTLVQGMAPDLTHIAIATAVAFAVLVVAYRSFKFGERAFADII